MLSKIQSRTYLIALSSGCLLTLAYSPFNLAIFGLVAIYLLLWVSFAEASRARTFRIFYVFGFAYFTTSLYWIGIALTAEIEKFWWLLPFAVILIPALLSLYIGVIGLVISFLRGNKVLYAISFSIAWVLVEQVRSYFPFDFAWNNIAYIIAEHDRILQIAPFLGLQLTSLACMLALSAPFSGNKFYISGVFIIFISTVAFGEWRLHSMPHQPISDPSIRIVQPSVLEHPMGRPHIKREVMDKLIYLSLHDLPPSVKTIVWPEAALPYSILEGSNILGYLAAALPRDVVLITGADRVVGEREIYNSVVAIDSSAYILRKYDKEILVPFGEYIPFRSFLPFLEKVTYGMLDFSVGHEDDKTFEYPLNFYPLICYEVAYPLKERYHQYGWMLNVTNDAWFGRSTGPYQHFAMAKFKAAEYGMSMLRAANNGISALISPYGVTVDSLALNDVGVLDSNIIDKISVNTVMPRGYVKYLLLTAFFICIGVNYRIS